MADEFFQLAPTDPQGLRQAADLPRPLPYHLATWDVLRLVEDLHRLLHGLNNQLKDKGYEPMERLLDPAGFSGLVSRATADRIARQSQAVVVNQYHNGYPDLLPRGRYPNDSVQHGKRGGLEVKASRSASSWQSHGERGGWFLIVQFHIDLREDLAEFDRDPTSVVGVYVAELEKADWSWQPAAEGKIRSGTASVKQQGLLKLREGAVWVDPAYEAEHQLRLETLRIKQLDPMLAEQAVLAALLASGPLHTTQIAEAVAPTVGVSNAKRLDARIKIACTSLHAKGMIVRNRDGRRFVYTLARMP